MKRGVQIELCGATARVHGWATWTCFPVLRSTRTPWQERRSLFRKDS
jgi:hypothetical protein